MIKKRLLSLALAFALFLTLMPTAFALERNELIVNPECGVHSINEKGQHVFEITMPDDGTPQPRPFLNLEMPAMATGTSNGTYEKCYSGADKGKLYGVKPGKDTYWIAAKYINTANIDEYDAILYITVVPADEYYATHPRPSTSNPGSGATPSPDPAPSASTSGTPTTGHTHDWVQKTDPATCIALGRSWEECSICGRQQNQQTLPKTEHSYVEGRIITKPTVLQTGTRLDKCSVCGATTYVELPKAEEAPLGPHTSGSYAMNKMSQQEIKQLFAATPASAPAGSAFDIVPSCTAPFAAGKVKDSVLQAALNRLNAMRKLAGLPSVALDASLTENAQYGAVINAANGTLTHTPSKQTGMSDSFYQQAKSAAGSCNLAAGADLVGAIDMWMDDSDASNIGSLGHRRWQINPSMGKTGFGYATRSGSLYGGYSSEKCFDSSAPAFDYDFVGWPASGNFPSDVFASHTAWSVSLNPEKYQAPTTSQLKVTMTRKSDGKTWTNGSGLSVNVDPSNYGVRNCIIFRPSGVGTYAGTYTVKIDGLKTLGGKAVTDFQYDVEFFPLNATPEKPAETQKPDETSKPTNPQQPSQTNTGAFSDVPKTEWFYDSVQQAYEDGVIDGTSYNASTNVRKFSPYDTLTIAEFTAIVTRAFYGSEIGQRNPNQPWYTPNTAVANTHDLLNGVDTRNMNAPASRFQMAQIMLNILEDQGEVSLSPSAIGQTGSQIADWDKVDSSYRAAVATCYSLGLLKGNDSAGTFNGAATMQRCECATVYIRLRDHFQS